MTHPPPQTKRPQIFFALTLYSYALHLRHGTYASLPLAMSSTMNLHDEMTERRRSSLGGGARRRRSGRRRNKSSHRSAGRHAPVGAAGGGAMAGGTESDERVSHEWSSGGNWSPEERGEKYEMTDSNGFASASASYRQQQQYKANGASSPGAGSDSPPSYYLDARPPRGAVPTGRRASDAFHLSAQSTDAIINTHGAGVTGVQMPGRTRAISALSASGAAGVGGASGSGAPPPGLAGGMGSTSRLSLVTDGLTDVAGAGGDADGDGIGALPQASASASAAGLVRPTSQFSRRISAGPAQPTSPDLPTFKSLQS